MGAGHGFVVVLFRALDEVHLGFFVGFVFGLFLLLATMQLGCGLGRAGDIKRIFLLLARKVGLVTVDFALFDGVGVLHLMAFVLLGALGLD